MWANTESFSAEFTQSTNTMRGAESRVIPRSSSWGSLAPAVWKLRQLLQYWEHGFGPQKIPKTQEALKMYMHISLDRYLYICIYTSLCVYLYIYVYIYFYKSLSQLEGKCFTAQSTGKENGTEREKIISMQKGRGNMWSIPASSLYLTKYIKPCVSFLLKIPSYVHTICIITEYSELEGSLTRIFESNS